MKAETKPAPKWAQNARRRCKMVIHVPDRLRPALERLAAAAGYEDGPAELALETTIPDEVIIQCVARSLINLDDVTRERIAKISTAAMEEVIRASDHLYDQWVKQTVLCDDVAPVSFISYDPKENLDPADYARLVKAAEREGITIADFVERSFRNAIAAEGAEMFKPRRGGRKGKAA